MTELRALVVSPDRDALRAAKRARRAAVHEYVNAMRSIAREQAVAIQGYHDALVAEAAANRTEARELREALAAILGFEIGGQP